MEISSLRPLISTTRTQHPKQAVSTCERYRTWVVLFICISGVLAMAAMDFFLYSQYTKRYPNQGKVEFEYIYPSPRHVTQPPCNSSTCLQMAEFLRREIKTDEEPCQNFNAFVCSKSRVSLISKKIRSFVRVMLNAYRERLLTEAAGDIILLRDCAEGREDTLEAVLHWFHPKKGHEVPRHCNVTYPRTPLRLVEAYIARSSNASVEGFKKFLFRKASAISKWVIRPEVPKFPHSVRKWGEKATSWISQSASCHYAQHFDKKGDVATYVMLWKALYFSPFLTSVYEPLARTLGIPGRRTEACLELVDDIFPAETRRQSHALLKSLNPNYEPEIRTFWHDVVRKVRNRLRSWEGNTSNAFQFLNAATMKLLPGGTSEPQPIGLLESSPSYSAEYNRVMIPFGLQTLLYFNTSVIDTSVAPYLGSAILEPLFRSPNVSSWTPPDVDAWYSHLTCIANDTSDSRLTRDISAAHIILSPLYWTYREHVVKQYSVDVKLNADFTNEQLFFVLWAAGRCGSSPELVNGPLRHSERFTKAFHCITGQGMVPEKRCHFWVR